MSNYLVPRRPLGSTGLEVSCLGLGTVKFGRNQGVKYPTGFELPDDRQASEILALAQSLGINLLDTAPAYGSSEERLGKLMTHRQDWILCSKTGEEFINGQSHFDFSAAHTRLSVERSLKRLRTDYLDVVLVHSDGNDEFIIRQTDCFETLMQLKQEGLIRAFGLSGKTVAGGLMALQYADVVMVTYNASNTDEREVIQQAQRLGKGVLIKKAFDSGNNPAGQNLRFVLNEAGVSSVIVGTINPAHLRDNAQHAASDVLAQPLSPDRNQ